VTYPEEHSYVTVIGDCYNQIERWQFGFRLRNEAATNVNLAPAIGPVVQNWWNNTGYTVGVDRWMAPSTHRLTEVKVARIGLDGLYDPDDPDSASWFPTTPPAGPGTPPSGMSPQQTMAVTLLTAKPRGLASKGRLYPPMSTLAVTQTTDGRIQNTVAQQLAASIKHLINDINALTLVTSVAVFSRGKGVASYDSAHKRVEYTYPNAGAVENVTGVGVGRVVDTQRRRRRQITELREEVTL
jgi:hypothetical protein